MGLITGLGFSTVFLTLDVEVDGGGITPGGGQVKPEAMDRTEEAMEALFL